MWEVISAYKSNRVEMAIRKKDNFNLYRHYLHCECQLDFSGGYGVSELDRSILYFPLEESIKYKIYLWWVSQKWRGGWLALMFYCLVVDLVRLK